MQDSRVDSANGKVYLVGAGPGDPGLITVKGLKCIAAADVLVYDRLVGDRLVRDARNDAELIYVGKLPQSHTMSQTEINQLLLRKARQGLVVTRLKGGDPFLFGRGGEEAEFLAKHGVPFEVVPGVTSAIAVPAYAGIPVTHRDFTAGFAVITGHEDPNKNKSNIAWEKVATGTGTLAFLMGLGNLPLIVQKLIENGRDPNTPVAVICRGTRPEQQTLTGTLADIVEKVQKAAISSPAVTIVGEVVEMRDKLQWFENKPLFGKRIVVTRSRAQSSVLSEKIEVLGGEPFEFPVIKVVPPQDFGPLDRAITSLESYRWVIFTSVNGVKHFFARLRHHGRDVRDLGARICAIGPHTKEALEEKGLRVDYVPDEYRAEALADCLQGLISPGDRVLLPRADIARPELIAMLSAMGGIVENVEAYCTLLPDSAGAGSLHEMLRNGMVHVVTFTSSSTVRNFVKLLETDNPAKLLEGIILASIGPVTSQTARELGLNINVEAKKYTIDGLIEALLEYLASNKGGTPVD